MTADAGLQAIVDSWCDLPASVKTGILALVAATRVVAR
jgi:hypothetical protein